MSILHLRSLMHTHHIGSQENEVVTEEPEETLVQELPEGHEPEQQLQECLDHRPSTLEKDKPRSILSLPNFC